MILPCTTASRPPSLKLVIEMPIAAPSMRVVRDHRALETELRIERDLAHVADVVAIDLEIGGGIAAHRRERAVADAVAAHDHVAGAKHVDRIAVLARAAGAVVDRLDAVVGDDGAVVAGFRSARPGCRCCRRRKWCCARSAARGHQRVDGDVDAVVDERIDDLAVDRRAGDGGAAGVEDFAVGISAADGHRRHARARADRATAGAAAVEHQARERRRAGARRVKQRCVIVQNQRGRATHADEMRAGRQPQIADAIAPGRERERRAVRAVSSSARCSARL